MNEQIRNLEPKDIWENFANICSIPHPSKHEEKIAEFMVQFGKNLGLETIVDEVGNVIIRKPATPGMENRMGVILQGHLDMVPQKNSDKQHVFETDPIETRIDGEWVKATGTTLGADNGIGVAAAMAVLQSTTMQHGPVEALFTIDEETGMTGAFGLKGGILNGDILMNLDSEDEGELYIGCAGGINAEAYFPYSEIPVPEGYQAVKVNITGMKGGHSGMDINMGRGNANKALFRFFYGALKQHNLHLCEVSGGSLRNAIPREAFATVALPSGEVNIFMSEVAEYEKVLKAELYATEPELSISAEVVAYSGMAIDKKVFENLTCAVMICPNGVSRMSSEMPEVPETSNNLAIVKSGEGKIEIMCLLRSSVDTAKMALADAVSATMQLAGGMVELSGEYPGWKPNIESPVLKAMQNVYNNKYGKIPEIKVIHAGLECGILGKAYPNWDMISFGPTIRFPHSPDEKVNIASVGKFWDYLAETLKNVPAK
ncbi:MAG: aminoacyl-histidine dipeptidase [Bacteroidetes bacterium]|nr:aminoacyl-histidine dipeptidase [Bacteroidota bacterium]MBU1719183.1 aminoacyl-histidine dipeptidase [Bacteroidota bacterium]